MNKFTSRFLATAFVAAMGTMAASPGMAAERPGAATQVPGQKIDSGLGDLPHYSRWTDATGKIPLRHASNASTASVRVAGEKTDSGVGDLPHFSQWVDMTGRQAERVSQAK